MLNMAITAKNGFIGPIRHILKQGLHRISRLCLEKLKGFGYFAAIGKTQSPSQNTQNDGVWGLQRRLGGAGSSGHESNTGAVVNTDQVGVLELLRVGSTPAADCYLDNQPGVDVSIQDVGGDENFSDVRSSGAVKLTRRSSEHAGVCLSACDTGQHRGQIWRRDNSGLCVLDWVGSKSSVESFLVNRPGAGESNRDLNGDKNFCTVRSSGAVQNTGENMHLACDVEHHRGQVQRGDNSGSGVLDSAPGIDIAAGRSAAQDVGGDENFCAVRIL